MDPLSQRLLLSVKILRSTTFLTSLSVPCRIFCNLKLYNTTIAANFLTAKELIVCWEVSLLYGRPASPPTHMCCTALLNTSSHQHIIVSIGDERLSGLPVPPIWHGLTENLPLTAISWDSSSPRTAALAGSDRNDRLADEICLLPLWHSRTIGTSCQLWSYLPRFSICCNPCFKFRKLMISAG